MAQVIRIKRRIGGAAIPATLAAGELAYNDTGAAHNLFVGNGTNVYPLVSNTRQVEIAATQTITGEKRIDTDLLKITGGEQADGNVLKTDGAGNLFWDQGTVSTGDSISGTGQSSSPLNIVPASVPQVKAGTDNVHAVTPLGLRDQLGDDAANLDTQEKTVVPAINELLAAVTTLTGAIILIGTYDAATDEVTPGLNSPFGNTPGPLPAPSANNQGWYLIVDNGGAGTGNAPSESLALGDWLLSDGSQWHHFAMNLGVISAASVSVNPLDSSTAANVQEALEEVFAGGGVISATDELSILGTGLTADPLRVGEVDGGEYT